MRYQPVPPNVSGHDPNAKAQLKYDPAAWVGSVHGVADADGAFRISDPPPGAFVGARVSPDKGRPRIHARRQVPNAPDMGQVERMPGGVIADAVFRTAYRTTKRSPSLIHRN